MSVLEKWTKIRAILAEHTAAVERMNEAEVAARDHGQLAERRVVLQQNLDQISQQINKQGFQQGTFVKAASARRPGKSSCIEKVPADSNMPRLVHVFKPSRRHAETRSTPSTGERLSSPTPAAMTAPAREPRHVVPWSSPGPSRCRAQRKAHVAADRRTDGLAGP